MPTYLNSRLANIFVAGFLKSNAISQLGPSESLKELIDIFVDLETNGLNLKLKGKTVKVYFVLVSFLGDNLGINVLSGFAPSFSSMFFCRFCKTNKYNAQIQIIIDDTLIRTVENYNEDKHRDFKETGIEEPSDLNKLTCFHVVNNQVVDIMHDFFSHGICNYDLAIILEYMIVKLKISLKKINYCIQVFDFGPTENRNKFRKITRQHISKVAFKMTAREMMMFIHYFPLLFGTLFPLNDKVWDFACSLVELVDSILLPRYTTEILDALQEQIVYHHTLYLKLFKTKLKPKYHIPLHYVQSIKHVGHIRYIWCFRFEAFHQIFKQYCRNITSRVNICLTLCIKAGLVFANNLKDNNFIPPIIKYTKGKLLLPNLEIFQYLKTFINFLL
ncbi:uncharacterized protein LOC128743019 [Sabethes cyaneus]|uniref:uncharacterized protein LOC128741130 n=1 Tax=Sabethes cyaneus TaxID=53552 RepID=UPI00237E4473|nr:uncharacterized protein LOC128741130 [Sabethes cyaneus]XP_053692697.1 uncharacterized protein LOC128741130 [Sabethes cyaneus]XP_053692698.1 uncharacterized protein LOC128741130 [Sabethes cyaneus]XP_053692699.1 uncharacterized protein LOC128741130 [Sabethes cyaneus]XP_053695496.1 uncharacterized protein LOC128743019 [Sabethes cyaneus]XP_053695497.1 uncharacterized protein LOC128743019 [Sabethes cyaneus]XP_053695498.1 uncharacterized protein LOC128743019 [Sabethes cyaneus]XP_053695499.1 unc